MFIIYVVILGFTVNFILLASLLKKYKYQISFIYQIFSAYFCFPQKQCKVKAQQSLISLKIKQSANLAKLQYFIRDMDIEPIIKEDGDEERNEAQVEQIKQQPQVKIERSQAMQDEGNNQVKNEDQNMQQLRIGDETLFTLPADMQQQQNNLVYRERKTRWGERQIKRSKIQQDAIFNPLEALYSGNSLLPITQYGQAEIQVKLALYSDGRRKKSKWHHEIEKTFTPPMINYIPPNIGLDEIQYLLRLYRLDELTAKINDFTPDDADIRSPSPEPVYDKDGRRINTRQIRKRDALHRERVGLIQDCMKMRKTFVPPEDYKPLKKYKKIYLTQSAMNDSKANYIGRIIGPEGKTQRLIEKRTKCKIGVRGRGTNKKQKDIFENYEAPHIMVLADTDEDLENGVKQIHKILNGEQDDQIKQLLESYNKIVVGMLDDNYCDNCQIEGHRTWACPFANLNQTNKMLIKCQICNETSHPTSDCPERAAYLKRQQSQQITKLLESQYSQFRSDLNNQNTKPRGTAFITDEKKQLKAIGADTGAGQHSSGYNQQRQTGVNLKKKAANPFPQQIILGNNQMPKFENDD